MPSSTRAEHDRGRRVTLLEAVGEVEQRVAVEPVDRLDDQVERRSRPGRSASTSPRRRLRAGFRFSSLRGSLELGAHGVELARARRAGSAQASPEVTASIRRAPEPTEPSERIANGADLGRRAHVRAAAELARDAVDLDDADDVAVLLAEEHHRAELARLVDRRLERVQRDGSRRSRSLTRCSTCSRSSGGERLRRA